MAKKTTAKKPKRRLKRTVRRSMAAVLMITAVVVAAIPVPENTAADPAGRARVGRAGDVHDSAIESSFGYDADGEEISGIQTAKWAKENLNKFVKEENGEELLDEDAILRSYGGKPDADDPSVHASLTVRDIEGNNTLAWQFLYYDVDIQGSGISATGTREVICMYNGEFVTNGIDLPMVLNTEYYTVDSGLIENYFRGAAPDGGNISGTGGDSWDKYVNVWPDAQYKYTLANYQNANWESDTNETYIFFRDYFPSEFAQRKDDFKRYLDSFDKTTGDYTADPSLKDDLVLQPQNIAGSDKQLAFYCANDKVLSSQNAPYTLEAVRDQRIGGSGLIYVAHGGEPGNRYYNDANKYLVTQQSENLICGIGGCTFKKNDRVTNLNLPNMINFIGDHAFEDANMISSINIASASFIGNWAFKNCGSLRTVTIGSGTNTIGTECFYGTPVTAITLPNTIRRIGYGAFARCNSLATLDMNAISQDCTIDPYAFYECPALTTVNMQDAQVVEIGDGAFACTGGAALDFVFPKRMTSEGGDNSIGDFMFAGRSNLHSVVFPENYGQTAATTVTLPSNLFHECVSLAYVKFPNDDGIYNCGFVQYDKEKMFADVVNENFYVQGPKMRTPRDEAWPRRTTWSAKMGIEDHPIPYLYIENGREYYEVSNGDYLYCVDDQGMVISCTLNPDADVNEIKRKGIDLVILREVGNRKVIGLQSGCFSDEDLNQNVKSLVIQDDSLASIDAGVFKGWKRLASVRIGNSVTTIGDEAFADCSNLIDVTFSSPLGEHGEYHKFGSDVFKTGGSRLTFHGDINTNYEPFKWAMNPDTIIDKDRTNEDGSTASEGIRVCYQGLAPSYITVMYNPITEMVTMLDYPKHDQIEKTLADAHGVDDYNTYREQVLYKQYASGVDNDNLRKNFAVAWGEALQNGSQEELYSNRNIYGPWINQAFCDDWESWKDWTPDTASAAEQNTKIHELTDWLFEPLEVQAADIDPAPVTDAPEPYYETYPYDVLTNAEQNDTFRASTQEEDNLFHAIENVEIPEGVESIDVYGYVNNLLSDGTRYEGRDKTNAGNYMRYFRGLNAKWDEDTYKMYTSEVEAGDGEDKKIDSVPGLFSGYYEEPYGDYQRGNDVIKSVTMHSVKYLPDYAFDSCENLVSVELGAACSDIGKAPFRGCYSMTTVGDNEWYTTDQGIIYSKNEDGSLTIEECLSARGSKVGMPVVAQNPDSNLINVSSIKPGAFEDCNSLSGVVFGEKGTAGLTVIPEDCFKNCDMLAEVILPVTVNSIEKGAFEGTDILRSLTVYGNEVKISGSAFDKNEDKKADTIVYAYEDSAARRYVTEYGGDYKLAWSKLGDLWRVTFYDANYNIIENMVDDMGNALDNPQLVGDGLRVTIPAAPVMEGWTFDNWVGLNDAEIDQPVRSDVIFYAQGHYANGAPVNGKYTVEFFDGIDGSPMRGFGADVDGKYYVDAGKSFADMGFEAPAHKAQAGYEPMGYRDYRGEWTVNTVTDRNLSVILLYSASSTSGGSTSGGTTSSGTTSGGSTNNTSKNSGSNSSSKNSSSSSSSSTSSSSTSTTSTTTSGAGQYTVFVDGGSGSGSYAPGTTVIISCYTPAEGMRFSNWTTDSNGVTLASASMTVTTFTMPSNNVTVKANYVEAPAAPAVAVNTGGGGGTGNTTGNTCDTTGGNGNTRVDIEKPGISNRDLATANTNGSTDNFIVKISETDEATRAVAAALTNKYGTLDNILYYAMDISLYDSTGTTKITDTTGLSVDITIPIPDSLVAYGGNNMAGAVINGDQLESLNENFTTINGVPCIRFRAEHFSPYTIYVDTGNLVEGMLDVTPKTGDPIHPKWFLSLGLACLSVILFLKKDKKVTAKAKA